jgi:hypothetical protein
LFEAFRSRDKGLCDRVLREIFTVKLHARFNSVYGKYNIDVHNRDIIIDDTFDRVFRNFEPDHERVNLEAFVNKSLGLEVDRYLKKKKKDQAIAQSNYDLDRISEDEVETLLQKMETDKQQNKRMAVYNEALRELSKTCRDLLSARYPKHKDNKLSYKRILELFPEFTKPNTAAKRKEDCLKRLNKIIDRKMKDR